MPVKSMRRIRRVFLAVAAVLLVALALLVRKAFESAASERSTGHRAVAERILDEMERELSAFLEREENRPFEHYRYSFLPETSLVGDKAAPVVSPLAGVPREPFLLGYFQIHPDGSITSPHRLESVATRGGGSAAEITDWIDGLENVVRLAWRLEEKESRQPAPRAQEETAFAQKAGSTVEIEPKVPVKRSSKKQGYLDFLNRGARSRDQRLSKLEQTQASNVMATEPVTEPVAELIEALEAEADDLQVGDEEASLGRSIAELKKSVAPGFLDVRLEPMVGRLASDGLLVLYRTVSIGEQAYRQGLLISEDALVDWLVETVVTYDAVATRATFTASAAGGDVPAPPGFTGYSYRHRFAEPFGSVQGVLRLEELPELAGTAYLSLLSLLLFLTATLGLFGLYRMVAVVVEFAERRHNFVSAVTHELKTPLTAIRMYGEMLRDGVIPDESKRQQYYETITAETERLTRLLQNVLDLARLENDNRTVHLAAGDVRPIVDEVLSVLEPHARELGFELVAELGDELPQVRFDRDALVQVLFNLVDNALKYARHAEVKEVVVRCRREGEGVALSVVDHGPGVSREHLGKIFEPFYRGENELTRKAKGTGIGLALVRGLVERMGGRVVGRNSGGGGFEVVVSLSAA